MTEELKTALIVLAVIFVVASVLFFFASFFIISHILYTMHLKRKNKSMWARECSADQPIQRKMYDDGMVWGRENEKHKKELMIVNEGLKLYGEYFDFGFKKAVIVVSGRTESLHYAYYFAKPYVESGYNVLAIDQRAHGESDGVYNTLGFEEYKDVLAWGKLLHDAHQVESIVLHGNCIGCSCCMCVLTDPDCPEYFSGLVAEGMYPNFFESFKNHMIELKRPVFPVIHLVDMWMRIYTGHSMKVGPIDMIGKNNKPLLMLHSKEDAYSLPKDAQRLYQKCTSKKKLVWFDKGAHSQIRIHAPEKYDGAIKDFLAENFN